MWLREHTTLKEKYSCKVHYKGGGRVIGNLTGGLIGTSDAERAARKAREEAERAAREQAEMMRKQIEEDNRRHEEQMQRAREEAERARKEQEKARQEAEAKQKAESEYSRQLAQDTGALALNEVQNTIKRANKTTVDYSNSSTESNFKLKDDDEEDKNKKKLRDSFKFKV